MTMDTITFVRRDSDGIAIELSLSKANGGVGRWRGRGCNGSQDRNREGSGDASGGVSGRFLHGRGGRRNTYKLLLKSVMSLGKLVLKLTKFISYELD